MKEFLFANGGLGMGILLILLGSGFLYLTIKKKNSKNIKGNKDID